MVKKKRILTVCILTIFFVVSLGFLLDQQKSIWRSIRKSFSKFLQEVVESRESTWSEDFRIVEIESDMDGEIQRAYFFKSKSTESRPLVVSLHTWNGDYSQYDKLAESCKKQNVNYIHPNFRGGNTTKDACCSELALNDIDVAITFAIENSNVDTTNIYVIGVSGGGYATLCTFMKSKHTIRKFSAWASITDLIAWYNESKIRENRYEKDILNCTESKNGVLNKEIAKKKSPLYWETPLYKISNTELCIYAGVADGVDGSVPITHSINFYNKLLNDMSVADSAKYVSFHELTKLLENQKPLGNFGTIAGREICLKKEFANIKMVIFSGNHEMLTDYALNELIED